ncbi:hypothetical protein [Acinetobacter sp. c3-l95]|uniref:hypothetical protein n=1 Tax=Acinetobacter sp. c3-l95 TaxID=3342804 RepID=UPI0035BB76EB
MNKIAIALSSILCFGVIGTAQAKTPPKIIVKADNVNGLKYGQTINKATLAKIGLRYPEDANNECYYVPLNNLNEEQRPTFLLVENNKLGMVDIRRSDVQLFSKTKIGDKVENVLKAHKAKPSYSVNKYDDGTGNSYHLIYDLANGVQIDYRLKGGQKLPSIDISSKNWKNSYNRLLRGQVESIAVGKKDTVALVEGCS